MKKLLLGMLGCMTLFMTVSAQGIDMDRVYGNELTTQEVIALMEQGKFLPVRLNWFRNEDEKQKAVAVALEQLEGRNKDYVANYNAAIVYATSYYVGKNEGRLQVSDENLAIDYATAAIKQRPDDIYMYLFRAEHLDARSNCVAFPSNEVIIENECGAKQALTDFEKVSRVLAYAGNNAELKKEVFDRMAYLARILGFSDKAALYERVVESEKQKSRKQEILKEVVKKALQE